MPLRIDNKNWSTILNIHYGACLSVIFALSIAPELNINNLGNLKYLFASGTPLIYFVLLCYFFLDCIVANTRKGEYIDDPIYVFGALVWIWFLGFCIVICKSQHSEKYVVLPIYIIVARTYQAYLYIFRKYVTDEFMRLAGTLATIWSIEFAIVLLSLGSAIAYGLVKQDQQFLFFGSGKAQTSILGIVNVFFVCVFLLKVFESYFFIHGNRKR
jgi:hypothetical protein